MLAMKALRKYRQALVTHFTPIADGVEHDLSGNVVVSLTSYPPRFQTLHLTLRSLLSQDIAPDALVLWVASQDRTKLPANVERLVRHGLIIKTCPDMGPFKKIIPALEAYPGATIVTADDDVFYPKGWLRRFCDEHRGTNEVLCQRARRFDREEPYNQWKLIKRPDSGPHVFPTGMAGVMYPPGTLGGAAVKDVEVFLRLCPTADDVWLYWMAERAGATHRLIEPAGEFLAWPGSQRCALWRHNHVGGENDRQITAMVQVYGDTAHHPRT